MKNAIVTNTTMAILAEPNFESTVELLTEMLKNKSLRTLDVEAWRTIRDFVDNAMPPADGSEPEQIKYDENAFVNLGRKRFDLDEYRADLEKETVSGDAVWSYSMQDIVMGLAIEIHEFCAHQLASMCIWASGLPYGAWGYINREADVYPDTDLFD